MTTTTAAAATITTLVLQDSSFRKAIDQYIDYNKPDRHVRQQMESWALEWQPKDAQKHLDRAPFEPTHVLAGDLIWRGEYLELTLCTVCYWKGTRKDGSIHFACEVVQGDFTEYHQDQETNSAGEVSKKEAKAAKRVHNKMIQRLKTDDYINKLIVKKGQTPQNLIEATVSLSSTGDLEERVYCDETTAEAIRRAIFTTGENSLDVFEFVVALPILPSSAHKRDDDDDESNGNEVVTTTPLADRVKLRCLEEATFDACEQEEDAEIVGELHISKKSKKG